MTGLGVLVASRLKSMAGFQMIKNFIMMPMFFPLGRHVSAIQCARLMDTRWPKSIR